MSDLPGIVHTIATTEDDDWRGPSNHERRAQQMREYARAHPQQYKPIPPPTDRPNRRVRLSDAQVGEAKLRRLEKGMSLRKLADIFGVSAACLYKSIKRSVK